MPDFYLTTPEVADQLGWSLSTLNSRIRNGEFAQEDVVLGGRYLGWRQSTVDAYRDEEDTAGKFGIDFPAVLGIIVQLRRLAETVRFYGRGMDAKDTGISITIPDEMYMVLGRLESSVRGNMVLDVSVTARFAEPFDEGGEGPRAVRQRMSELDAHLIEFWLSDRVPTVTNGWGRKEPDVVRAGLLRQAAHQIADEQRALRKAFVGRTAHMYYNRLSEITAKIHAYADGLAPDSELREAMSAGSIPLRGPEELIAEYTPDHDSAPSAAADPGLVDEPEDQA
ncbi:helix-turn-helix transcriptional regulator [Mycobacteroides abscessus subsp. abscessus]|uniref:helix-turn-helix transcriptional regulator n=1 Tax=Mycobacteroides abscessus TaxID=36809 RepID=UPI0039F051B4